MTKGMVRVLLVVGCVSGLCATSAGASSSAVGSTTPSPPQSSQRATQGEMLYRRHCADCHGWEGQGNGPFAQTLQIKPPRLRRAELFTRHTDAELVARVLIGLELSIPPTVAQALKTEAEETAIMAYLRRLPTLSREHLNKGEETYDSLCLACHGIYGRGDGQMASVLSSPPRDLSDPGYQSRVTNRQLHHLISEGKGAMPATKKVLNAEEITAVIAFVRLLSPGYELYDRFCAVCHGPDGQPLAVTALERFGGVFPHEEMPTFDQAYFQAHTDAHIRPWVQHMLKENRITMPHFSGALDAEEVRAILTYLRTLAPES